MSDPAQRQPGQQLPRLRYPDELSAKEIEETQRVLDVDGEAYLLWLAGEGPDPCPPESSG